GIRFAVAISRPLIELQQGVTKLAKEFDETVEVTGHDEIGALTVAFNKMADRLRTSHFQLIDDHHDLERRVASRTSELSQSNIQLQAEVQERKRAEEQLAYLAKYDTLTK